MNQHPDKKQLIGYIIKSTNKKAQDMSNHLKECNECKSLIKSIDHILKTSENTSINPSAQVERRILSILNNEQNKKAFSGIKPIPRIIFRPALAVFIILCAVAIFLTYNFHNISPVTEKVSLSLLHKNGEILYNNNLLKKQSAFINTGSIITDKNSSAVLSMDSLFNIDIAENTEFIINSAVKKIIKRNDVYEFNFDLKKGDILAEWKDHNIEKIFTIKTKNAHFQAIGTKFILSQAKDQSRIAVLEGNVRIILSKTKDIFIIESGEGLICNSSSKKIQIIPQDEINRFEKLFNKKNYTSSNASEKAKIEKQKNKEEMNESPQNKEKQNNSMKNTSVSEFRKEKREIQRDSRKIQREMRKSLRSGNKSKR